MSIDFFVEGSSREGRDLCSHYIVTWGQFILHSLTQLTLGPLELQYIVFFILPKFRNNYQAVDFFTCTTFATVYQSLLNVSDTLWVHDGDYRYDLLLTEFFSDPSRSGPFYLDGDKYASFAITFTKYLINRYVYTDPQIYLFPRSHSLTYKCSKTYRNRCLSDLSILLSKASYSKELASLLNLLLFRIQDIALSSGDSVDAVKTYCNRVGYLLSLRFSWV